MSASPTPLWCLLVFALPFVFPQAGHSQAPSYQTFKAYNGVSITYTVLLPTGYQPDRSYPTAVAFSSDAMDEAEVNEWVATLWSNTDHLRNWIVVIPLTPGPSWRTHPNHHALNALMDHVKTTHRVFGDTFHLLGYEEEGVAIASTWAGMSHAYFASFTAVNGIPFRRWDEGEWQQFLKGDGNRMILLLINTQTAQNTGFSSFVDTLDKLEKSYIYAPQLSDKDLRNGGIMAAMGRHGLAR